MKKSWFEPHIDELNLNMTTNDLTPGDKEDDLSWNHGFASFDLSCGGCS